MKIVERAPKDVTTMLEKTMRKWHPSLAEAAVKIGVVLVSCDSGPAITNHGAAALARIRRLNERDRLLMRLDATIEVHADYWEKSEEAIRIALLDHELTHLVIKNDKKNNISFHADGRPKLAIRPDDWQITGFYEVVERHGDAAPDAIAIRNVVEGQLVFPFMIQGCKPASPRLAKQG